MLSKSVRVICFLTVFILIRVRGERVCLSDLKEQPTYNTDSPIHITVSKAKPSEDSLPIGLLNDNYGTMTLKNKGNILEADVSEDDKSFIFSGVLCEKNYTLSKFRVYVNPDGSGRSGHIINGTGYPVEFTLIYYDSVKYKSFDDAVGETAAIVQVTTPVEVGSLDNPLFDGFDYYLSTGEVKHPGSSIEVINPLIFALFSFLQENPSSIAYIGSYYNPNEKKQSPGAICLVAADVVTFISKDQFSVLIDNVLDADGKPLKAIAPIAEQGNRPIYKGDTFVLS